jgi:hypothetical protein
MLTVYRLRFSVFSFQFSVFSFRFGAVEAIGRLEGVPRLRMRVNLRIPVGLRSRSGRIEPKTENRKLETVDGSPSTLALRGLQLWSTTHDILLHSG